MSKHKALHRHLHTFAKAHAKAVAHIKACEGPADDFNKSLARRYTALALLWCRSMPERLKANRLEHLILHIDN